jgi:5-formyltetrahydrofolate cyclo-ligase
LPAAALAVAKRELRARILASPVPRGDAARAAGLVAAAALLDAPEFRQARRVALFASLGDEPPTRPLFETLRLKGVGILMPRVVPDDRLEFLPVRHWAALRPGPLGVLEPPSGAVQELSFGDVVVVPGLAFDRRGGRLGRGKGYYDRSFPSGLGGPRLIGYAWACRIVAEVPMGPHDRRIDALVTEFGAMRFERRMEGHDGI